MIRVFLVIIACAALLPRMANGLAVPPSFELSLDAEPSARWRGAVQAVLAEHDWDNSFGPVFESHNRTLFDHLGGDVLSLVAQYTRMYWPEAAAELDGISQDFSEVGHPVSFTYLAAWVWFHELDHTNASQALPSSLSSGVSGCCAILASDRHTVYHARNMDQSPPQVRNITLEITVTSGGKELFKAVDWYWITTGFMTVMKGKGYSVQENYRFDAVSLPSVLSAIKSGIMPQVFLFRNATTHLSLQPPPADVPLFRAFVNTLVTTKLAASMYAVVAGTGPTDGVIITMGLDGALDQRWLGNSSTPVVGGNDWSLVQTNYDPWLPDKPDDARRTAAQAMLNRMGHRQAAAKLGTFVVASTSPVYNGDTAYTAVMHAAGEHFESFVRRRVATIAPP